MKRKQVMMWRKTELLKTSVGSIFYEYREMSQTKLKKKSRAVLLTYCKGKTILRL